MFMSKFSWLRIPLSSSQDSQLSVRQTLSQFESTLSQRLLAALILMKQRVNYLLCCGRFGLLFILLRLFHLLRFWLVPLFFVLLLLSFPAVVMHAAKSIQMCLSLDA